MLSPRHTSDYPDRNLDCQEALQAYFQLATAKAEMLAMAVKAGWSAADVNGALPELERYRIAELNDDEPE